MKKIKRLSKYVTFFCHIFRVEDIPFVCPRNCPFVLQRFLAKPHSDLRSQIVVCLENHLGNPVPLGIFSFISPASRVQILLCPQSAAFLPSQLGGALHWLSPLNVFFEDGSQHSICWPSHKVNSLGLETDSSCIFFPIRLQTVARLTSLGVALSPCSCLHCSSCSSYLSQPAAHYSQAE